MTQNVIKQSKILTKGHIAVRANPHQTWFFERIQLHTPTDISIRSAVSIQLNICSPSTVQ